MNKEILKRTLSKSEILTKEDIKRQLALGAKSISSEEVAKNKARQKERDSELIWGIFKNLERPGADVSFDYNRYGEAKSYTLIDGEKYCLPRGVIKHITNNCYVKEELALPKIKMGDREVIDSTNFGGTSKNKQPQQRAFKKVHRFSFQSLEFMDEDFSSSDIAMIETI